MKNVFQKLDTSENGKIDCAELKFGLKKLGLSVDQDQIDEMLAKVDDDHLRNSNLVFLTFWIPGYSNGKT